MSADITRQSKLDPEWKAGEILNMAKRQLFFRTFERTKPLFKFRIQGLGASVYVELMPSQVLRVHDYETGEILAQSQPGDFNMLDMDAPRREAMFRAWCASRVSQPAPASGNEGEP